MNFFKQVIIIWVFFASHVPSIIAYGWFPMINGRHLKAVAWSEDLTVKEIGFGVNGRVIFKDKEAVWKIHYFINTCRFCEYAIPAKESEIELIERYLREHKEQLDQDTEQQVLEIGKKLESDDYSLQLFKAISENNQEEIGLIIADAIKNLNMIKLVDFFANCVSFSVDGKQQLKNVLQAIDVVENISSENKKIMRKIIMNAAYQHMPHSKEFVSLYACFTAMK